MKRRPLFIIIVCMALLAQSGCSGKVGVQSSYKDLSYLRLIQTMGVDTDPAGVRLTAATGQVQEGSSAILISRGAASIPQAIASVEDYSSDGILFYSHCLFVLLGREKAEEGVEDIMDYMQRDEHMRMDTGLVAVKNAGAQEFMTAFDSQRDLTEVISSMDRDLTERGSAKVFDFRETALALSERDAALVCLVEMVPSDDSVYPETGSDTCRPAGFGVLCGGRLSGTISYGWPSAAVGLVRGWLGTTDFTLPGGLGIESSGSDVKIEPVWNGSALEKIKIDATLDIAVTVLQASPDPEDEDFYARIERSAETELRRALEAVIGLEQELNADFLDFTTPVRISGGGRFDALPGDWVAKVPVELGVRCAVNRSFATEDRPSV